MERHRQPGGGLILTRAQVAEIARREGLPLHAIERDYAQHAFIRHAAKAPLAFKGGTCLRIVHGSPRYSEDLDFDGEASADAVLGHLEAGAARLRDYGIPAEIVRASGSGVQARLRFEGPLFDGTDRSRGSIRLDVSLRRPARSTEEAFVPRTAYPDVPQLVLRVLTREHLLAEKTRALLVRGKPRDLYDVHFLVTRGVRCPRALLDAKMALYEQRFSLRALDAGIRAAGLAWAQDLGPLLGQVPPLRPVESAVREAFRPFPPRRG